MFSNVWRSMVAVVLGAHSSLLFGQAPVAPASRAPRTWTTTEGKAFQASFLNLQGTLVAVRLATGQLANIQMLRLSAGDQEFVKASLQPAGKENAGTAVAAIASRPLVKPNWPVKVEIDSRAIEVKTVLETDADRKYIYRSQAFEFTSEDKLAGSVMVEIARTFEATRALVEALPWGIGPKPPANLGFYQAKFYLTQQSYVAAGGPANTGGVYMSADRIFRVPFHSLGLEMRGKTWFKNANFRNDAMVHEITHQMMHEFIPFLPIWVAEGTAEYTEMLPFNAGRFLAGSHERGIKDYIKQAESRGMTPSRIGSVMEYLTLSSDRWHERANRGPEEQFRLYFASCLLVYYFSHLDGEDQQAPFLNYMEKINEARNAWDAFFKDPRVTGNADGSFRYRSDISLPSQTHGESYGLEQLPILLKGRTPEQMQKAVTDGFKKIGVRW